MTPAPPHFYLTILGDLVALSIAAAMVVAFGSMFFVWLGGKVRRAFDSWRRTERIDNQFTKEDAESVEEKK